MTSWPMLDLLERPMACYATGGSIAPSPPQGLLRLNPTTANPKLQNNSKPKRDDWPQALYHVRSVLLQRQGTTNALALNQFSRLAALPCSTRPFLTQIMSLHAALYYCSVLRHGALAKISSVCLVTLTWDALASDDKYGGLVTPADVHTCACACACEGYPQRCSGGMW